MRIRKYKDQWGNPKLINLSDILFVTFEPNTDSTRIHFKNGQTTDISGHPNDILDGLPDDDPETLNTELLPLMHSDNVAGCMERAKESLEEILNNDWQSDDDPESVLQIMRSEMILALESYARELREGDGYNG